MPSLLGGATGKWGQRGVKLAGRTFKPLLHSLQRRGV